MKEKRNVLIFSGATYPAIQICECLKFSPIFHVIMAASYPNHSEFICDDSVVDLPFVTDTEFVGRFQQLILDRKIEFVIPTDDTIALVLMKHQAELPAVIVCSPYETAKLCRYKSLTYQVLAEMPFTPRVYEKSELDAIADYPIFIKPDNSQGSRGAMLVNNRRDFDYVRSLDDMIICEYLPGEEFTVDCFTDRFGKLLFCNPRLRERLMNGITARGCNVPCTEEFSEVINDINEAIQFRGYWFAQLKRDCNGKLKLLELCTRFAGSFGISKARGVNLPLLALCDFAQMPTEVMANDYTVVCDKTYFERYRLEISFQRIYIDYDDTVTYNDGKAVNPYVIAFLYQCLAKGLVVCLLTRHEATFGERVDESMERLGISSHLFQKVFSLSWNEKKTDVMDTKEKSIFIDNSFTERKAVHDVMGIPVFDVSNLDCLFDWRA